MISAIQPASRLLQWMFRGVLLGALLTAGAAFAVNREVTISYPVSAAAGGNIGVTVTAHTDAGGGEQIGFLHAEYSADGGKTWTGICYEQKVGPAFKRAVNFKAGAAGSQAMVRVRVAFRDGAAGDVDYKGAAIKWEGSWAKWETPPAKQVTIRVVAP